MKKLLVTLMCVVGLSIAHADGGLFGLIGSAVNAISGGKTASDAAENNSGGSNNDVKTNVENTTDGWKIYVYPNNYEFENKIPSCSNG